MQEFFEFILHLNLYVGQLVQEYHAFTCVILMLIIFGETGLVIMPFLPGDSLLFAAGLVFSTVKYDITLLIVLLIIAAFAGDNCNYWIGRILGRKACVRYPTVFKPQYLIATENFYAKYGIMAIVLARFLPLLRTFIPFFAGLSRMYYQKFLIASIISATAWVSLFTLTGYYFGNLPWVQSNFSLAISLIIIISVLPALYKGIAYFFARRKKTVNVTRL